MRWVRAVWLVLFCCLHAAAEPAMAVEIRQGLITISLGSDVDTMDPHASSSAITSSIHRYVFDTLTHRPKGAVVPVPWAAESFRNVDERTFEFKMREGAK